jgi:hypothetical protein
LKARWLRRQLFEKLIDPTGAGIPLIELSDNTALKQPGI